MLPAKKPTTPRKPPILIIGPTTRCGSSLLQRLFNSTGKIVIYGENFAFMNALPDLTWKFARGGNPKRKVIERARELLVKEKADFEASSLFPAFDATIKAWRSAFQEIAKLYDRDAAALGYNRWGLKHQLRGQASFPMVAQMMPRARLIMIYRDLLDVVRSAKARWPEDFETERDFKRFAQDWVKGTKLIRGVKGGKALVIRYEDFVADPEPFLKKLEAFTGIEGIDRSVMSRKINAQPTEVLKRRAGEIETYKAPAKLSAREIKWLLEAAGPFYRRAGYGKGKKASAKPAA